MTKRINSPDTEADIRLRECLDKTPRISFNMIAGAGSGKTTSLVKALNYLVTTKGQALKRQGQQVACITYTEIAAKEIWNDIGNDPLVHVSTIHSFLWTIIRSFQKDIKKWVVGRTAQKITDLENKITNYGSRVQQRTKEKDAKQLQKLIISKSSLEAIQYFNYGTGSNYLKGILGHDDIVRLVPELIEQKPMLKAIVSQKFPYLFVDESQDTFQVIVSAFKKIERDHTGKFCLGFFGDPMQKIYLSGIGDIPTEDKWITIKKPENFRCSKAVLDLINAIRSQADGLQQTRGRMEEVNGELVSIPGSAQVFVFPIDDHRTENLQKVKEWCSIKFNDPSWGDDSKIKIFVIVHRMAAIRLGFPKLYSAMNDDSPSSFKDGFQDGTSWPLRIFLSFILPLVQKNDENQQFDVISIARENSPKLMREHLKQTTLPTNMKEIKKAVDGLSKMMKTGSEATVLDVFMHVQRTELTVLDSRIIDHINGTIKSEEVDEGEEDTIGKEIEAMKKYFACPASELWGYKKYIENESPFATQQGVKGAEFDRVITILDDDEGTHNQFSYDKYFGVTDPSKNDTDNIQQGKDSVIERTRRLFYVSCSRAKKELVVVYYTGDVEKAVTKVNEMAIFPNGGILTAKDLPNK